MHRSRSGTSRNFLLTCVLSTLLPCVAIWVFGIASLANAAAPFSLEETFDLHSLPGATRVIYLDFDGYVGFDSRWGNLNRSAFNLEGSPSTFSDFERERIQKIWQRVAEDFIPFNVDVTTADPGVNGLRKSSSGDTHYGIRASIKSGSIGGQAYIGSFDWSTDTLAKVKGTNEKDIAEVISHEVGHSLGLRHDGKSPGTTYYNGHGSGNTRWAPIMGTAYSSPVSQWSRGAYNGANNTEDDLAIITSQNGFGYRADDHGSLLSNATELDLIAGIALQETGIIERNTDKDVFQFTVEIEGPLDLTISPAERGANLDIQATLFDGAGMQIALSSPSGRLDAEFHLDLEPGDYYLEIDGVGSTNNPATGYDDYASLGFFSIFGTLYNPIVADLNNSGSVEAGDIDLFVQGWLTTDHPTIEEQVAHGDFNLDGITNLADAFLFHEAIKDSGNGALASLFMENVAAVPEPSTLILFGVAALLFPTLRFPTVRKRSVQ